MRRELAAVLMMLALWASPARAHELPGTTATLTVRPGHLEVRISVALLPWLARLDGVTEAQVAAEVQEAPARLELRWARARATLVRDVALVIDGHAVTPAAVRAPALDVVREVAARARVGAVLGDTHAHPERVVVVLEVRLEHRPSALTARLPAAMGPAVIQLIEPAVRSVPPAQDARFALSPPGA